MELYFYIALVAILLQLLFLLQTYKNYYYALDKYKKKRLWHKLRAALIVPCKGLDPDFQKNISSFYNQDYENYLLWFVVAEKSDPAYNELLKLKDLLSQSSKARDVQILVAGTVGQFETNRACSQKIHNLLYCYENISDSMGVDVLAFADSDICVRQDWLSHLVWPLRHSDIGASSGYRWFIPKKNNLASLASSAANAKVAQLLGNTRFNQAWGGSMAIRKEVFQRVGLDKIWHKVLSDDLSLTYAVKKAGLKVAFCPACLAASHESTTWRELFEFGRRQFLITRIYATGTWWFGLFSSIYSILGLWAGAALAIYAASIQYKHTILFIAVPVVFFLSPLIRAILRQRMISILLKKDVPQMKAAMAADIIGFWAWSLLLFVFIISSAFGRTIRWRGIRYKLLGPTETIVLDS
jgi:ceramide glucosyltransferase